ncbi:MAG: hypothetical protein V3V78_00700, partial [Candidatus Woesearchaeota archaeon]
EEIAKLTEIDIEKLNELIIIDDVLDIEKYHDGFIIVKKNAPYTNGKFYDLAVMHSDEEKDIISFYNIPILSFDVKSYSQIYKGVLDDVKETGRLRHLVWTPKDDQPALLDIVYEDSGITIPSVDYWRTTYQEFSAAGGDSDFLKRDVESIIKNLSRS